MALVDYSHIQRIFSKVALPGPFRLFQPLLVSEADKILGPYAPYVGSFYHEHRILFYATAQNLANEPALVQCYSSNKNESMDRLNYKWRSGKPERSISDEEVCENCEMSPIASGVIPALISIFLKARYGRICTNPTNAIRYMAFSNFYKLTLVNNGKFINPNSMADDGEHFAKLSFKHFVAEELNVLRPKVIVAFKGIAFDLLSKRLKEKYFDEPFELIDVHDPSWILRGSNAFLTEGGKWDKAIQDGIGPLLETLCSPKNFRHGYADRSAEIKRYLNHYHSKFLLKDKKPL